MKRFLYLQVRLPSHNDVNIEGMCSFGLTFFPPKANLPFQMGRFQFYKNVVCIPLFIVTGHNQLTDLF